MKTHAERAVELFEAGYNCAQAVVMAYAEELGMDAATAARVSAGLGGGVGRLRETCGTVTGMALVAGLRHGSADGGDAAARAKTYAATRALAERFRADNGSLVCRELLGLVPPPPGVTLPRPKRPCKELVRRAAAYLEEA